MNVGDRLGGKYRLVREIGAGAMASVWEAVDETTTWSVAIKLMGRCSEDLRQRFLREARICASISHPNVVEMYDIAQAEQGEAFIVMQLLTGETLAELLVRRRRLPVALAAKIGRDVARALEAAHAMNVVHRDLKPANVFLHQEAGIEGVVIKVLDFGIAKDLRSQAVAITAPGGMLGSPSYMSPEQAQARGDVDGRADIWALGVLLFEMLVGNRLFRGSVGDIVTGILTRPLPRISSFKPDIDPAFDDLVARCIERDREKRIGSAAEICQMLEPFIDPNEGPRVHVDVADSASSEAMPDNSPDGIATIVPSSGARSQKAKTTVALPEGWQVPPMSSKGTVVLADQASSPPSVGGPRGTVLMAESGDLRGQVAQARIEIATKLSGMIAPPPTLTVEPRVVPTITPAVESTPAVEEPIRKRSQPIVPIVVGIVLLAVVVVAALYWAFSRLTP